MQKGGGSGGQQRGSACAALRPIPARHGIEQAPPGDAEGHPDDARERAGRKQTGGGLTSGAHAPPRERGEPGGTPGGRHSTEPGVRPETYRPRPSEHANPSRREHSTATNFLEDSHRWESGKIPRPESYQRMKR